MPRWWSQHGEDATIARLLGDDFNRGDGYYVDVGAWSDNVDSVTRAFYDMAWQGVNVEPVQYWFKQLVATRPRDVNLNCAVGEKYEADRHIHVIANTGLSTLLDGFDPGPYEDYYETVEVRTLADICAEYPCPPDRFFAFGKIDVEGFEAEVLRGADFSTFTPRVLCIEADKLYPDGTPRVDGWEPILLSAGYRYVYSDPANRYYVRGD
jgi:FkbM family methyltransferase